MRNLLDICA